MADLTVMAVLKKLGKDILGWVKSNCVNNLVSTATNLPLAANQGKVLDEKIDAINQSLENVQSLIPVQNNSYAQYIRFGNIVVVSGYYHKTNSSWDIFNGLPYPRLQRPFIVGKAYSVAGTENIIYVNENSTLKARIVYNTELMYFTCAYICE